MKSAIMKNWSFVLLLALTACQSTPRHGEQPQGLAALDERERELYQSALGALDAGLAVEAEAHLYGLSKSRPEVAEVWFNLALARYQQSRNSDSLAALERLFQLRSDAHQGHNLAGLIALKEGRFAKARTEFERALELKPDYANTLYNLALLWDIYLQDIAQAVAYYRRYLELVPEDEETKVWMENLQYSLEG